MGSVINITPQSYSEQAVAENWAGEFAKNIMEKHKTSPVLDHPDGSVTEDKLSQSVKEMIERAVTDADTAKINSSNAIDKAAAAYGVALTAEKIANFADGEALNAEIMADNAVNIANTAKAKSEAAEQRAISSEAKADAAAASASGAVQKAETAQSDLQKHSKDTNIHTTAAEKEVWNNKADKDHVHNEYAKLAEVPSKVSELENDSGYLTEHQDISGKADKDYVDYLHMMINDLCQVDELKSDKTRITTSADTVLSFEFSANHNAENRTGELETVSFTFGDGEYAEDYISGLSFNSGETPTAIDYTDSGILNWVGTDCATSDGLSIFQPSANTHYDIVFYFNGTQFIGLVNGFVPATGNEAV